jgi:hypothetical protein
MRPMKSRSHEISMVGSMKNVIVSCSTWGVIYSSDEVFKVFDFATEGKTSESRQHSASERGKAEMEGGRW